MGEVFNIYDAKTRLSELVERAARGEEIVIAKAGNPKVKLVPIRSARKRPKPGLWKGTIWMSKDFDAPLPQDILDAFEGKGEEP
jgi:prevent-host-death family protein